MSSRPTFRFAISRGGVVNGTRGGVCVCVCAQRSMARVDHHSSVPFTRGVGVRMYRSIQKQFSVKRVENSTLTAMTSHSKCRSPLLKWWINAWGEQNCRAHYHERRDENPTWCEINFRFLFERKHVALESWLESRKGKEKRGGGSPWLDDRRLLTTTRPLSIRHGRSSCISPFTIVLNCRYVRGASTVHNWPLVSR